MWTITSLRLRRNRRGASNIIVVVLSLVIIVIIVSNIVLWSYEMNQLDWEKIKEDISITNVERINRSSWFVAQSEYTVNMGSRTSGTYTDTQVIDSSYERFSEAMSTLYYYPSEYILGGSTSRVSGSVSNLTSDDGVYMAFRSYSSVTDTSDFVDETCDLHSPSAKGTHSNFTAQQYGPDSINDTLTEENTGTGNSITPITAFQDTQQSTSSTSLVDANCETSALSNGVKYLVIYSGNHGGSSISSVTEMVLEFGTTVIARSIGEGRGQSNHYDTNTIEGYYIVTGDGTNTLKFRFRLVSDGTAYCGAMAIIAIPLTDLSENTDYFQSVSNAEDVVVNAVVGSWTTLMTQTFSLPDAGDYLVLMSGEGGCDGGSSADAMMRFRVNGATIGSEHHEEWEDDNDQMNFAKAQLVTGLSAGDNSFTIECQSRGSAVADFHRPRIVVIRKATFDQIVNTYDTSGDTTTSTSFVDFAGLTTTYTPNQAEYVIVLANFGLGTDGLYVATAQLRDETAGANYRVDGGEYNNDGGFDSNRDQIIVLLAHAKQLTSGTQWKVQYRTTAFGTAAIGRNPDNTAGIRSDLILWSMTIAGGSVNYELDLEVQWTNVTYTQPNELCIYGGTMDSENIRVDFWNGSAWQNVFTDLTNGWNNVSVSSYLTSSTFTIRFNGGTETGDTTQSNWNIDVTLLHVWFDGHIMEVEFVGSSNTQNWAQLTWTIDSAWTSGSVNVTLQLYNYTLGDYPTSGNGYINYFSSATANTYETQNQTITQNPTHFRNATGYWKMRVKGVKATDTSFDFKADWVELSLAGYKLDLNGTFTIDLSTYLVGYIQTVEIQLRYMADDAGEKWYLKAYNWTSSTYSDSGFNSTAGHTPTTGWDYYAVNLTDKWRSYVNNDGTIYVKFVDETADSGQTTVDIDFLGARAVIDGTRFTFKNEGALTSHLVSLWIINSTNHRRYDINIFVNSADTATYLRADISLPAGQLTVKVVTERGNIAVYSGS